MSQKKKILIADDDPAILEAIQIMLETAGYEVYATDDATTIDKVKNRPDLILLDIWMSGQDGRLACKTLKANKKTSDIPVVLVSANRYTEKIAQDAGADDFITKPFEMDDLLEKVQKFTKS